MFENLVAAGFVGAWFFFGALYISYIFSVGIFAAVTIILFVFFDDPESKVYHWNGNFSLYYPLSVQLSIFKDHIPSFVW